MLFMLIMLQQVGQSSVYKANSFQAQYSDIESIAHGDIDGDGYTDILIATHQPGNMLVYRNDQNNGFKAQFLNLPFPRYIVQVDLADINGDGKLDLLLLSNEWNEADFPRNAQQTSYLEIYTNQGSVGFNMTQPDFSFVTQGSGVTFRVGDFNQDNHQDIISTISQVGFLPVISHQTQLYSGDGNGAFTSTLLDIELQPSSQLADFNLDGYLDIWNLSGLPGIYVYEPGTGFLADNKQTINFTLSTPSDPNNLNQIINSYSDVALADLDGDGDIDVQAFVHNGDFVRFLNEGSQFIQTDSNIELPLPFIQLIEYHSSVQYGGLIDLENDGKPETWVGSTESENVLLISDSAVHPDVEIISTDKINKFGKKVVIDDFNADGRPDVVSVGSNGLVFWQNKANQQLTKHQTKDGHWGRKHILRAGDINADGHVDMVLAGQDGIEIKQGNGLGSFSALKHVSSQEISELLIVDLNDDEQALVGVSLDTLYKWQKYPIFEQSILFKEPTGAIKNLQSLDFNQDGLVDLAYINGDKQLIILEQGSLGYEREFLIENTVVDFKVVESDKQAVELIVYVDELPGTFNSGFMVMGVDEQQSLVTKQIINETDLPIQSSFGNSFGFITTMKLADMDLDGVQDVVIPYLAGVDEGLVWLKKSESSWQGQVFDKGNSELLPFALELADFNHDGYLDVFGAKVISNINGLVDDVDYISLGSPTGLQQEQLMVFDLGTRSSELVDVDKDGDLDLLQIGLNSNFATQLNSTNDNDYSGLWFNPSESGHGLQVEQIVLNGEPAVNFSWFAFHDGLPFWLVGVAPIDEKGTRIPVIYTDGAEFGQAFDPEDVKVRSWGQVDLTLNGNELLVAWETAEPGFQNGSMTMQRLSATKATDQTIGVINSCHAGSWFNAEQSGHGFFVNVIENQGEVQMTLAWYHYLAGKQKWLVAQGPVLGSQAFLSAQAGVGAQFPPLYDTAAAAFSQWGQIDFTLLTDSTALISWYDTSEDYPAGDLLVEKLTALDRYQCPQ